MGILFLIAKSVWYILPAYMANNTPVFARKIDFLNYPVSEKLFGKNKTYRGFFFGVIMGILIAYFQAYLYSSEAIKSISLVDYSNVNVFFLGFLMGAGALSGDIVKSFIKRRIGIAPGKPWIPFDQTDFLIGALLFVSIIYLPKTEVIVTIFLVMPFIKLILDQIGYLLGINKVRL